MARKKKIKEQSTEASVKYTGQVTIEKIRANKVVGRKVIKNTGCMPLFKFFADCLTLATAENAEQVGLFNSKPQYLNCFYKDSTDALSFETFGQSQVRSYMKQTGVVVTSTDSLTTPAQQSEAYYSVNIKFLLQDNNFRVQNSNPTSKINVLALYGSNNVGRPDQMLPHAYIVIENSSDYLEYIEGVNYLITWTLKIANK